MQVLPECRNYISLFPKEDAMTSHRCCVTLTPYLVTPLETFFVTLFYS